MIACSEDHIGPPPRPDSGLGDAAQAADASVDGGGLLPFAPPSDPGPGGILITASGEVLALGGYVFPPATPNDPAFVDGWEVTFKHLIVTIDRVTLSANPDTAPGDQSQTGPVVAEADGPWAIDLHKDDPSYLAGKGGAGERAAPIAALSAQNRNGNAAFATDGTRYAFGFDVVPPAASAYNVNLGPEGLADYAQMIADQCTVLYDGQATFKGTGCGEGTVPFDLMPATLTFKLCFRSPTSYVNAQNPDNDPAKPFPNEEHQRGVAFKSNTSVIGQVTIHTDHPFWESVVHDSPAHFDMLAARVSQADAGADAATPEVTLDMMKGVDFLHFKDALGNDLPWRACLPPSSYTPPDNGTMHFDPQSVPQQPPSGDPAKGLRDAYDFMTYDQSTQGHLNSNGLAYVKRNYPSPP
jgi:hypothetical protein